MYLLVEFLVDSRSNARDGRGRHTLPEFSCGDRLRTLGQVIRSGVSETKDAEVVYREPVGPMDQDRIGTLQRLLLQRLRHRNFRCHADSCSPQMWPVDARFVGGYG